MMIYDVFFSNFKHTRGGFQHLIQGDRYHGLPISCFVERLRVHTNHEKIVESLAESMSVLEMMEFTKRKLG